MTGKRRKLHVLIVEDNPIGQMVTAVLLRELGHSFTVAGTVAEALAQLENMAYDAILMDSQLPDGSGVELTRRYKAGGGAAPVIAATGVGSPAHRAACEAAGMAAYLEKPYTLEQLRNALETHVEHAAPQ